MHKQLINAINKCDQMNASLKKYEKTVEPFHV